MELNDETNDKSQKSDSSSNIKMATIKIPWKHSYKLPPGVCTDITELQSKTTKLLSSRVGDIIIYESEKHSQNIWESTFPILQETEYLLRGHASFIPGSLYYNKNSHVNSGADQNIMQHYDSIQEIMQRMKSEGESYMKLRQQHLSQIKKEARASSDDINSNSDDSDDDDDDDNDDDASSDSDEEKATTNFGDSPFAPPGISVHMVDVLLDVMAAVANKKQLHPSDFSKYLGYVLERDTVFPDLEYFHPTRQTFNAVLRGIRECCNHSNNPSQELTDNLLHDALLTYNAMIHHNDDIDYRNSHTIIYMIEIIQHCLPPSRVSGNIVTSIMDQACSQGIVSDDVLSTVQSFHTAIGDHGPEFRLNLPYLQSPPQLQQSWSRNVKRNNYATKYY